MNFYIFSTIPFVLFFTIASAQLRCGADQARRELLREHPEILINERELEEFTKDFIANQYSNKRSGPYVIPVVFHIIHQGGQENISKADVLFALDELNRGFNKMNADTSLVIPEFKNNIANMEVKFRLAQIDPWGNCTDGIDRIYSSQTWVGDDYSKLNNWPRDKYLNIWVVSKMRNGVAGYSYYPGSVDVLWNVPARDGVMILYSYLSYEHTLAHEVGHWSNLKHCWGDTNEPGVSCGDDDVDDTPVTKGWAFCPSANNAAVCTSSVKENYQNIMEYSYCSHMFTNGQKARVHAALNSTKGQRNNIHTEANLIATGTQDGFTQTCAPKADFYATQRYACAGQQVKFVSSSFNGPVDDIFWEFPNGTPSTSNQASPTVVFDNPGWQEVKLTVSNQYGSSTKVSSGRIFIAPNQPFAAPYYDDFEQPGAINEYGWVSVNYDENETYFSQVDYVGRSGNRSLMLNNYYTRHNGDIDEVISPPFDLTGLSNQQMNLSFYYSLGSWDEDFFGVRDSLVVYATSNCGGNWVKIYNKGGASIINAGYQQGFYVPGKDQSYWRFVKINIPSSLKQPNVRFKIQVFSSVKTNNFYIDDFNLGSAPVGNTDMDAAPFFISPNPALDKLVLSNLPDGNYTAEIRDVTGRLAQSVMFTVANGESVINLENLSGNSVYLLTVISNDYSHTIKFVKQ
ncbi:MAG: M43 family zinc metalloprotease [Chitinophagales bacterium]|nr:M43 family zinc metalloprotease [Chitinophagales bacterium]MDW8419710.1 M43 family zinc metalloprotease [Chitinophagales bacterium]